MVATKHFPVTKAINAVVTVGIGSPYSLFRADVQTTNGYILGLYDLKDKRDKPYYYLAGPIGGVSLISLKKGGCMVEWDSQHLNVGAYALLFKHWTIQAGFSMAISLQLVLPILYTLLRLPKRFRKHEWA